MIKVSVTSTEVRNQSGNAKATGNPYSLNFQTVWVHTSDKQGNPNPYPEKVEIILEKNRILLETIAYNQLGEIVVKGVATIMPPKA